MMLQNDWQNRNMINIGAVQDRLYESDFDNEVKKLTSKTKNTKKKDG